MSIFKITSVFEIAKRGNQVNPFTIQEAELELAALREAGEKMKSALEDIQETETLWGADLEKSINAIEAWEAANK